MRFRLRTLLIVLAVGPAVIAGVWFLSQSVVGSIVLLVVAIEVCLAVRTFAGSQKASPDKN